jgi:hypothetical protein
MRIHFGIDPVPPREQSSNVCCKYFSVYDLTPILRKKQTNCLVNSSWGLALLYQERNRKTQL